MLSGGAGRRALGEAIHAVVSEPLPFESYPMAGKTDPAIIRGILEMGGYDHNRVTALLPKIIDHYARRLADLAATPCGWTLLPGVRDLLDRLAGEPGLALGLVTGNIKQGAATKLGVFGLGHRFSVGAFGDDSEDRNDLPPVALKRAREAGLPVAPGSTVIVGDTPADIACARAHGIRVLAVATGPYSVECLSHADEVLANLANGDAAVTCLQRLLG
ncbi:MAG: haloacid dehalogenase-like hydrolase [Candidatus Schekmanbacteria bacterium]|nr:haloacid dehalogenase-like hydrolase [Candidatus Schekmanbacteria bacterium]